MKINKKIRKKRLRTKFLKGAIQIGSGVYRIKKQGQHVRIVRSRKYPSNFALFFSLNVLVYSLKLHFGKIRL